MDSKAIYGCSRTAPLPHSATPPAGTGVEFVPMFPSKRCPFVAASSTLF